VPENFGAGMLQEQDNELVTYLEKQVKILTKAKESGVRKYNMVTTKMQKNFDKLKK